MTLKTDLITEFFQNNAFFYLVKMDCSKAATQA